MPRILDNIEARLDDALVASVSSAQRLDAAVGYFNLRGWGRLADAVDAMPAQAPGPAPRPAPSRTSGPSASASAGGEPAARLLIGMAEMPQQELLRLMCRAGDAGMDNRRASRLLGHVLADMRRQLMVGVPTAGDERTLRMLRRQLAQGRVRVGLFLRHRLHAKLYLCHRSHPDVPTIAYVGSSDFAEA